MSEIERYDVLVFDSGAGGKITAWVNAKEGLRTAVAERGLVGGSCPNIACLPTKNVVHSAKVADFVRHDRDFGSGTAPASIEMTEVRARKRRIVEGLVSMHLDKYKESGAELVFGEGSFVGLGTIEVRLRNGGVRTLKGDRLPGTSIQCWPSCDRRRALREREGGGVLGSPRMDGTGPGLQAQRSRNRGSAFSDPLPGDAIGENGNRKQGGRAETRSVFARSRRGAGHSVL
jgi:hypothetical protein